MSLIVWQPLNQLAANKTHHYKEKTSNLAGKHSVELLKVYTLGQNRQYEFRLAVHGEGHIKLVSHGMAVKDDM